MVAQQFLQRALGPRFGNPCLIGMFELTHRMFHHAARLYVYVASILVQKKDYPAAITCRGAGVLP